MIKSSIHVNADFSGLTVLEVFKEICDYTKQLKRDKRNALNYVFEKSLERSTAILKEAEQINRIIELCRTGK